MVTLVDQARTWIHDCITNHPGCVSRRSGELPARLLTTSETAPGVVRLVHTDSITDSPRYAALSYCWGGHGSFQLTSTTLDELQ